MLTPGACPPSCISFRCLAATQAHAWRALPLLPPALQASAPKPGTSPAMNTPHMEVFQHLLRDMDTGGCKHQQMGQGWSCLTPSRRGCGMFSQLHLSPCPPSSGTVSALAALSTCAPVLPPALPLLLRNQF